MDESFNNVVEGTRQYFMGLPKPAQDGSVQQVWPTGSPAEEGAPALSSAGTNSSRPPSVAAAHSPRPPSTAAAPPSTSTPAPIDIPSRPPSEPLEPEPHIIHKATVMREAAEKRRELPDIEDEEEAGGTLSPPSHIIRKPTPHMMPSPAPASAVPSPSPVRPPSAASSLPSSGPEQIELPTQYRTSVHRVQTPTIRPQEHYNNSIRSDQYLTSRQSDHFMRYQYDQTSAESGRIPHSSSIASPQSSVLPRQSPQTYARISSAIPQHTSRLNEASIHNSIVNQRYSLSSQPPPPHNDRVPPIHHPQAVPAAKILTAGDIRSSQMYKSRESSSYSRTVSSYERHQQISQRKYDPQQTYSGYRPSQQVTSNHNIDKRNHSQYKHGTTEAINAHYAARLPDRPILTHQPQHVHEHHRVMPRTEYLNKNTANSKNYSYPVPSTSSVRYVQNTSASINQNNTSAVPRSNYRSAVAPKSSYDYSALNQSQTYPSRPAIKTGYQNPQTKMTVSVTSIVDQMNQTKQRRESPLDLSVKTVKNSADSSTTQDDVVDSASMKNECFTLQPRLNSNSHTNVTSYSSYGASHKVDFAPDFAQYRGERMNTSHSYNISPQPSLPGRHNEAFEQPRPVIDPCTIESRHVFAERTKYQNVNRNEYVPRIDLTRSNSEEPHIESRIRDDRHFIIEDRKRIGGPDISNIPKKILKYETWSSDSRIDRLSQSAREQRELMSRPVYNYQSYKRFEAYQNDQKRPHLPSGYRDPQPHVSHRYSVSHFPEQTHREANEYHSSYNDKILSVANSRHIIQKIPSQRDIHPHMKDLQQPADKKVLSILRNSLEIKQNFVDPLKPSVKIPDLIVIDDGDDPVIDITDLTKETESDSTIVQVTKNDGILTKQNLVHDIQMPKAVDSITKDDLRYDQSESKTKSPENDVASRIRTKAELKVMPPSQDNSSKSDAIIIETKILPKSQKQHLFNQIREDNLRLESVIKTEKLVEVIQEIKSEPMSIEEIEKDAIRPIKTEHNDEVIENNELDVREDLDMDWATACDSFMEQLKEGCQKRKVTKKITENVNLNTENKVDQSNLNTTACSSSDKVDVEAESIIINIKQEPKDQEEEKTENENLPNPEQLLLHEVPTKTRRISKNERNKNEKKSDKENDKVNKNKTSSKSNKNKIRTQTSLSIKKEVENEVPAVNIKEEAESTDDDEPLIKSKLLKEKEQSNIKYQLLKELAEKSAYVKLECCDDISKRKSLDSSNKDKDGAKSSKNKVTRQTSKGTRRLKEKHIADSSKNEGINDLSSDSDDDVLSVSSRLRVRKVIKSEDPAITSSNKSSAKFSPTKRMDSSSSCSTPLRKSGFGDGSDFHPGWEEELYKYKRSLRMPTRLIAIPRGRSGGPFLFKNSANQLARGSTSLPDLDPVPLSPAPSSAQSAATDDIYRRPDKNLLDSDLESNSSCSAFNNKLQYDSEASTSTIFSTTNTSIKTGKSNSIVDVLIKKCGRKEEIKKKLKDKEEKSSKILPKSSNTTELLPTPSLGLVKNGNKGNLSAKKEKLMEDIFYLGAFRKETVTMFRTAFINNTNGLIGATEEFAPVVLKSRTRTESRVLKQRATIKEVFGDDRPASAPPSSCREEYSPVAEEETPITTKKEVDLKTKLKTKTKNKILRRSSSIRDGLRSTKSLKRNDAKGRMMRLKKRNSLLKSLISTKKNKLSTQMKVKTEKSDQSPDVNKDDAKEDNSIPSTTETHAKKRFKRLFGRRKFSSGFDYIRKKKKIIRRDDSPKVRRQAHKPSPESVHDIQKEIKGWFINKSIGETHLHRAARLGFTDCVAYCLEKMKVDPSAKDNAGFTALHVASAKGHVRIARLLLQYGANVSAAAQGGIRPLHEACENSHVEVIRLLLAYGADPILGTYAGQTPEELAEGVAAKLLRLHIADVQGLAVEPWIFPSPAEILDRESLGCDPLSSPPPASPPPPPDSTIEIQCSEAPLPPFYSLRSTAGQPAEGLWCLLQDITNVLQIKSKESLLKQIHCGSGSPKELLREIKTQEFLERAQCHQLLCAGEKVNIRASKVALIRVTDKLRQLLKIETVLVS